LSEALPDLTPVTGSDSSRVTSPVVPASSEPKKKRSKKDGKKGQGTSPSSTHDDLLKQVIIL
jgi:hypothetical protein